MNASELRDKLPHAIREACDTVLACKAKKAPKKDGEKSNAIYYPKRAIEAFLSEIEEYLPAVNDQTEEIIRELIRKKYVWTDPLAHDDKFKEFESLVKKLRERPTYLPLYA